MGTEEVSDECRQASFLGTSKQAGGLAGGRAAEQPARQDAEPRCVLFGIDIEELQV